VGNSQQSWGLLMVMGGFELSGRGHVQLGVEMMLAEPVDPF
jgi:hypothetical protein